MRVLTQLRYARTETEVLRPLQQLSHSILEHKVPGQSSTVGMRLQGLWQAASKGAMGSKQGWLVAIRIYESLPHAVQQLVDDSAVSLIYDRAQVQQKAAGVNILQPTRGKTTARNNDCQEKGQPMKISQRIRAADATTTVKPEWGISAQTRTANRMVDEKDVVEAVMLLIHNDAKIYQGLTSGKMKPAEAAKEGRMQYLGFATANLREDVRRAQPEVEREVKEWLKELATDRKRSQQ